MENACYLLIPRRHKSLPDTFTESISFNSPVSLWQEFLPVYREESEKSDNWRRITQPSNLGLLPPNLPFYSPATLRRSLCSPWAGAGGGGDAEKSMREVGTLNGNRRNQYPLIDGFPCAPKCAKTPGLRASVSLTQGLCGWESACLEFTSGNVGFQSPKSLVMSSACLS